MKKIALILGVTLLVLTIGGCVPAGEPIDIVKEVEMTDTSMIDLELISSDVTITPENRETILIEYHTYDNGTKLDITDGRTLYIEEYSNKPYVMMSRSPKLNMYVPEDYTGALKLSSASGEVNLSDFTFENLDIHVSSGNIDLRNIDATTASIKNTSGEITIDTMTTEKADIVATSGTIRVTDFIGEISGKNTSGNTRFELRELVGDIDFDVTSGNITIDFIDGNIDALLNLRTTSGDVDVNLKEADINEKSDNRFKESIGDGTYNILITNTSGDIVISD